jgi:hypothetical protein
MDGVPQILGRALRDRAIEVAVVCIEGCGTSILSDPSQMEKVCDRITGSDSTEPDQAIIDVLGPDNILDPETAKVDNIEGVCVAYDNGIHKVAVTTGSLNDAQVMRDMFGTDLCIIGLLEDGFDADRARDLLDIISTKDGIESVTAFGKELGERSLLSEIRIDDEMGARAQHDYGHAFLPEPPSQLLVVGKDVTPGPGGHLDDSIIAAVLRRDDLVFARQCNGRFGIPVVHVLQFPDQRSGDDDPDLAEEIPQGEVQVHLHLKRHE